MPFEEPQNIPLCEESSKKEEDFSPGEFLRKKYPDNFKELGNKIKGYPNYDLIKKWEPKNPNAWVDLWYHRMRDFHDRHRDNPEAMGLIRNAFHENYVIKPENVPESYFQNQQRLARERGYGDRRIPDETRERAIEVIISDQKSTLDNWVNYFFSSDADVYPMWARYWAMQSITKLSTYDKEKKCFGKRRNDTVAPFPDLDREAFAYIIDIIVKKTRKESIEISEDDTELKKTIEAENFGKLYAYAIEKITPAEENELAQIEGEWIKYPQGSDHMSLVNSLQGYGTGWCTAGEETAKTQLAGGDFYVYYSKDKHGNCRIPRVAIRMQEGSIGEVRGVAADQNLDPYIGKVVDEKIAKFPDGEKYKKKTSDMQFLTAVDKKQKALQKADEGATPFDSFFGLSDIQNKNNSPEAAPPQLTSQELRFLYEVDSKIESFGYSVDPRIREIIAQRNVDVDLPLATGFRREEISLTQEEALRGGVKFHWGGIDLSKYRSVDKFIFPELVSGDVILTNTTSAEGTKFPEIICGDFEINYITSLKGVIMPKEVRGCLVLPRIKSVEELVLPEKVGSLFLGIESAIGLKLPEIAEDVELYSLKSPEDLVLPESVDGNLNLSGLQSADGLTLPNSVQGDLFLCNLKSAKGLKLPKWIGGALFLDNLESVDDLIIPEGLECLLTNLPDKEKDKLKERYPDIRIISI